MISLAEEEKICNLLTDNHISGDVFPDNNHICIEIHWGDWKKSHIHLKHLMSQNGYKHVNTQITEEDGSDCYSAIHTFALNISQKGA